MKTKIEELKKLMDDLFYSADLKLGQCDKFQEYLDDIGQELENYETLQTNLTELFELADKEDGLAIIESGYVGPDEEYYESKSTYYTEKLERLLEAIKTNGKYVDWMETNRINNCDHNTYLVCDDEGEFYIAYHTGNNVWLSDSGTTLTNIKYCRRLPFAPVIG
jgi:hypothetical protein